MVSKDDMKYMAELCKIGISDEKLLEFKDEFNKVIGYIDQLKEVNVEGVKPTYYGNSNKQDLREDIVEPSLQRDEAIQNAPEKQYGYFKMLRVMD